MSVRWPTYNRANELRQWLVTAALVPYAELSPEPEPEPLQWTERRYARGTHRINQLAQLRHEPLAGAGARHRGI